MAFVVGSWIFFTLLFNEAFFPFPYREAKLTFIFMWIYGAIYTVAWFLREVFLLPEESGVYRGVKLLDRAAFHLAFFFLFAAALFVSGFRGVASREISWQEYAFRTFIALFLYIPLYWAITEIKKSSE